MRPGRSSKKGQEATHPRACSEDTRQDPGSGQGHLVEGDGQGQALWDCRGHETCRPAANVTAFDRRAASRPRREVIGSSSGSEMTGPHVSGACTGRAMRNKRGGSPTRAPDSRRLTLRLSEAPCQPLGQWEAVDLKVSLVGREGGEEGGQKGGRPPKIPHP